MPNFVIAGFRTDISSAGFCLTVEALRLPPAQGLSFQPSPMISRHLSERQDIPSTPLQGASSSRVLQS